MSRPATRSIAIALGVIGLTGATAQVSALDFHQQIDDPVVTILGVDDFQTTGADMAGMLVTAHFSASASESVVWQATGTDSGGVFGANQDWSLTQSGDSFHEPWNLFYGGGKGLLVGFSIDGMAAGFGEVGVMFDRTFGFEFGTPGSFMGWDYQTLTDLPFDTVITYRSAIALPGEEPVGDLFRYLDVRFMHRAGDEFSAPGIAGLDGVDLRSLSFIADTDNNIIPEPGSLALLSLGGLMLLARRRNPATR